MQHFSVQAERLVRYDQDRKWCAELLLGHEAHCIYKSKKYNAEQTSNVMSIGTR